MFDFHKNLKKLITVAFLGFVGLSMIVAIGPAVDIQKTRPLPGHEPLTDSERRGLELYVSENCMACHTQQVRNIEMDDVWGERPSIPSDYYYSKQRLDVWRQSPSLLGSERTGPDLTNVGQRQPSDQWHLLHLYNPRSVVGASIMPSYPWLFELKPEANEGDVVVPVPPSFVKEENMKVIASQEALDLVAYLKSLKQTPLPGSVPAEFIPAKNKGKAEGSKSGGTAESGSSPSFDGASLYTQHCGACHQANGQGLPGAFPSLVGSPIVNDEDPDLMVRIILQGYDARSEFSIMPGFASQLSDDEIAAIANHERSSWGNTADEVTAEEVKEIRALVMKENNL